jgi:hypothetical protein
MQASDLLKMKQGQVVYTDLKRQLGTDPCDTEATYLNGLYFKSYELREVIREGVKACTCDDGNVPCIAPLPQAPKYVPS